MHDLGLGLLWFALYSFSFIFCDRSSKAAKEIKKNKKNCREIVAVRYRTSKREVGAPEQNPFLF